MDTSMCVPTKLVMSTLPSTSNMKPFCKFYLADDSAGLKCHTCIQNYVVSDQGNCVSSISLPNCLIALSVTECSKCVDKFVIVAH